ncbi:MAG: saccharopine dehydrogenase C-terminal domain-containing protein, partial [Chitinophagaceae bacterium]
RTTLRHPSFCKAWNCVVNAFLTDEDKSAAAIAVKHISFREWVEKSIRINTGAENFENFLTRCTGCEDKNVIREMFTWLGLLGEEEIPLIATCSADILQFVLENKLSLLPQDKDMIVMLHEFEYETEEKMSGIKSSLIVKGENNLHTAMAKTVGLPLGIAAKLILNGTITTRGLHIPVVKDIYEPVLKDLEHYDIKFNEERV